jgi:hypothetical protein
MSLADEQARERCRPFGLLAAALSLGFVEETRKGRE